MTTLLWKHLTINSITGKLPTFITRPLSNNSRITLREGCIDSHYAMSTPFSNTPTLILTSTGYSGDTNILVPSTKKFVYLVYRISYAFCKFSKAEQNI